ncbi:MAG: hypothetical protein O9284_04800 [Steroidobacteraceae bacterium]|jgi:hypothetical protein|nr:hypothetical protein [Steroidobacteraceae bacterium]
MHPDPVRLPGIPAVAALALVAIGAGMIFMTAGRMPGIAVSLESPRWFMGLLGGALVGAGLLSGRWLPRGWRVERLNRSAVVAAIAAVGALFGEFNGLVLPASIEWLLNTAGRVLFPVGLGALIGWAAVHGSRNSDASRPRR